MFDKSSLKPLHLCRNYNLTTGSNILELHQNQSNIVG